MLHIAFDNLLDIQTVAARYGVTYRCLRFYEERELLAPLRQGQSRLYRPEDERRLQIILKGRQLGFSVREIKRLIDQPLKERTSSSIEEVANRLDAESIRAKIAELTARRDAVQSAIDQLKAAYDRAE